MNPLFSFVTGRRARILLLPGLLIGAGCLDFDKVQDDYCRRHPERCADGGLVPAGDGGSPDADAGVTPPVGEAGPVLQVSASPSGGHTLVRRSNGSVWAWGRNNEGQLGDGSIEERARPVQVVAVGAVEKVAAGSAHSIALNGGQVWFWGTAELNGAPQEPVLVPGLKDITDISAGGAQSLAVRQNGEVYFFGADYPGGRATVLPVLIPGLHNIESVSAGTSHALALDRDHRVWAVGLNDKGQLGLEGVASNSTAVQVPGLPKVRFIAAGARHSLAVDEEGQVWAWGENDLGQLGAGTKGNFRAQPRVVEQLPRVRTVAAGHDHSLALTLDKEVWAWGSDSYGQLGDGSPAQEKLRPVKTESLTSVTDISAGFHHSLALTSQRLLHAWGRNNYSQLGNEEKANVYSPGLPVFAP